MIVNTNFYKSHDVAIAEEITRWWTREMEIRECVDGWDVFFCHFHV